MESFSGSALRNNFDIVWFAVDAGMRRAGNELRWTMPNFRLNSTLEFRKRNPNWTFFGYGLSWISLFLFLLCTCTFLRHRYTLETYPIFGGWDGIFELVGKISRNEGTSKVVRARSFLFTFDIFIWIRRYPCLGIRATFVYLSRREFALTLTRLTANINVDKALRSKGIKWQSDNPISRHVAFAVRHNYIQLKAQQVTTSTIEHAYIDRYIEAYSLEHRTSAKSNWSMENPYL